MNLVLSCSAPGSGDRSLPGPHLDLVKPVATCASSGPSDCGPTQTSPGSRGSGSHMRLSWTWFLWSPTGLTCNTMTLNHIWASPGSVDSGPYLAIIGTWILSYIPGPHLDLVTLVATWASSGHGSSAWPEGWPHLHLVSGVPTWVLPMPGDTGPHVGLT